MKCHELKAIRSFTPLILKLVKRLSLDSAKEGEDESDGNDENGDGEEVEEGDEGKA